MSCGRTRSWRSHDPDSERRPTLLADLRGVHEQFAWFVVLSNGLTGTWALGAHWLAPLRRRSLWWFIAAAQTSVFVEVGFGVGLVSIEDYVTPEFHAFYGFIAIVAIAIIHSYRAQLKHRLYLLYGVGGLFVMGLAIRAMALHR